MGDELEQLLLADKQFLEAGVEGLAASSPEEDPTWRFFDQVRMATQASLDRAEPLKDQRSVIVMSADPRNDASQIGVPKRLTDINLKQPADWQGRLIFVAAHGTTGWALPLPNGSTDDALHLLEDKGFGEAPVAIFYPERLTLSCFMTGGMSNDKPINLTLPKGSRSVSLSAIFDVLEDVQKNSLLTPMIGPPKFWTDPKEYVPGPEAERTIRWIVAAQMRSSFRPMEVNIEHVCAVGSIDIIITDRNPPAGTSNHAAVIELKALKSFTSGKSTFSPAQNVEAIMKGHRQARAYRDTVSANLGVMAAFDMRKKKDDPKIEAAWKKAREDYFPAGDTRIDSRIFPVYGTTDDAQGGVAA